MAGVCITLSCVIFTSDLINVITNIFIVGTSCVDKREVTYLSILIIWYTLTVILSRSMNEVSQESHTLQSLTSLNDCILLAELKSEAGWS